jgi:hypothetical protein
MLKDLRLELGVPDYARLAFGGDFVDVFKLYQRCYSAVFNERADNLARIQGAKAKLESHAKEAGCSVELYIMACMLSHVNVGGRRFYATQLFGKSTPRLVRECRLAAIRKYGVSDSAAIADLFGAEDRFDQLKQKIIDTERLVGLWLVGFKRTRGGKPHNGLYLRRELALEPAWLAFEQSYADWLSDDPPVSESRNEHRQKVKEIRSWIEPRSDVVAAVQKVRQDAFIHTVHLVVSQFGFELTSFMAPNPVTDIVRFWGRLGLAIQHVDCLKMIGFFDER